MTAFPVMFTVPIVGAGIARPCGRHLRIRRNPMRIRNRQPPDERCSPLRYAQLFLQSDHVFYHRNLESGHPPIGHNSDARLEITRRGIPVNKYLSYHRTSGRGWCCAQRIQILMIAGGNHTTIYPKDLGSATGYVTLCPPGHPGSLPQQ